jgi:hypothetical protein
MEIKMTAVHCADKLPMQRETSVRTLSRHGIGSLRLREVARFVLILASAFALISAIVGIRLYAFFAAAVNAAAGSGVCIRFRDLTCDRNAFYRTLHCRYH